MQTSRLDLYVIIVDKRHHLFSTPGAIAAAEAVSADRVRQFIEWIVRRRNRLASWIGRGIRSLHDYYTKLEDKIDPTERVLKAMASTNRFVVHSREDSVFRQLLKSQRRKHLFWFSVDLVITAVVIVLTPFLAPIPGPNVFFYYPFLRLLSHYRAILGAASGLRSSDIQFKDLPELRSLAENLPSLASLIERMD